MDKTMAELSSGEFEKLIERALNNRMGVWLTQLLDSLPGAQEEGSEEFEPAFAESLKQSIQEARSGLVQDLTTLRNELGS